MNIKIDLPADFLDEEVRWDYTITPQMKKVWAVELDLICELDRVCKKYGLKYYACAGTALGVERHGGFIPWDDDVDLMMFRDDYEKLLSLKDEFKYPYFLQHQMTDRAFMYGFAKLQNIETTAIEQKQSPSYQGIFIDIFPLDNVSSDEHEIEAHEKEMKSVLRKMQMFINSTYNYYPYATNKVKLFFKKIVYFLFKYFSFFKDKGIQLAEEFDKACKKYHDKNTQSVSILAFQPLSRRYHIPRSYFENEELKDFEFIKLPVIINNKEYLERIFGDYMKPIRGGSFHEGIFFDTENSYTKYINVK